VLCSSFVAASKISVVSNDKNIKDNHSDKDLIRQGVLIILH